MTRLSFFPLYVLARLVQQPLSTRWGQPVVIDNRPGANAIIATQGLDMAGNISAE